MENSLNAGKWVTKVADELAEVLQPTVNLDWEMKTPDLDSKGRDRNDYARCKMCKVSSLDKELSFQPSLSVLVFGAFPSGFVPMESRCDDCEKKVSERVNNISEALLK